jgi:CRISPR/Cas system CSM-associated protein Csm3 (group 7 of RAMP superfamily)
VAQELRRILGEYLPGVATVKGSIDILVVGRAVFTRDECSRGVLIASGGEGEMLIEAIRVGDRIHVPTSSIKGVFRRIGEAIAKSIASSLPEPEKSILLAHCESDDEGVAHVCYDITHLLNVLKDRESIRLLAERGYVPGDAIDEIFSQLISEDRRGIKRVEPLLAQLCPVCRVFGGPGLAGKLRILRVMLGGDDLSKAIDRLAHTSIDRSRRVVLEGALFVEEYVDLKRIVVEFVAQNVVQGSTDYRLLMSMLSTLKEVPLLLGHSKSRGLGWYRLDTTETRLVYLDLTKMQSLHQFLNAILNPFSYGEEVKIC